jgi:hypothetical protein
MILYSLFEGGLECEKTLIDRCRIIAIECNHLGSYLAALDHFERIRLDAPPACQYEMRHLPSTN